MIELSKNNFFRNRESDFKKRMLVKINVSKNMLKNDQRVYGQTSGGSKVLSFPKIPESNPLAMETFIYTSLLVIV